jgi:hypothetical protein
MKTFITEQEIDDGNGDVSVCESVVVYRSDTGENFYETYRVLQSISNPVSPVMFLYLILMQRHEYKQNAVEEFIKG